MYRQDQKSCLFFCCFGNNPYLCNSYPPIVAKMSSEEDGAVGWGTTY